MAASIGKTSVSWGGEDCGFCEGCWGLEIRVSKTERIFGEFWGCSLRVDYVAAVSQQVAVVV
jgi:hypothetical protein